MRYIYIYRMKVEAHENVIALPKLSGVTAQLRILEGTLTMNQKYD